MKNLFSIGLVILTFSSLLCSCSQDDFQALDKECNKPTSELILNLENLNHSILSSRPQKSRGFWSWRTLGIAVADLRGAKDGAKLGAILGAKVGSVIGSPIQGAAAFGVIGAVAIGALDSKIAYELSRAVPGQPLEYAKVATLCKATISDDFSICDANIVSNAAVNTRLVVNDDIVGTISLDEKYLSIGKVHNIMLAFDDETVDLSINTKIDNPTVTSIVESQDFKNMYNDYAYKKINGIEIESDPLTDMVIDLFIDVFEQYSDSCDDVAFIINKYIEVLENTNELDEFQLNAIKAGLATALYSFNYWDQTLK